MVVCWVGGWGGAWWVQGPRARASGGVGFGGHEPQVQGGKHSGCQGHDGCWAQWVMGPSQSTAP